MSTGGSTSPGPGRARTAQHDQIFLRTSEVREIESSERNLNHGLF